MTKIKSGVSLVLMKKILIAFLIFFSFLLVKDEVLADWWSFPTIAIPDFTLPTATPTPTTAPLFKIDPGVFKLFSTSTPAPSNTPIPPTVTTAPTVVPPQPLHRH